MQDTQAFSLPKTQMEQPSSLSSANTAIEHAINLADRINSIVVDLCGSVPIGIDAADANDVDSVIGNKIATLHGLSYKAERARALIKRAHDSLDRLSKDTTI